MEGMAPRTEDTARQAPEDTAPQAHENHTAPENQTAHDEYDPSAVERWAAEPDKRPGRTAFQRDRARVLHAMDEGGERARVLAHWTRQAGEGDA